MIIPPVLGWMRKHDNFSIPVAASFLSLLMVLMSAFHPRHRQAQVRPLSPPSLTSAKTAIAAPRVSAATLPPLPAARPDTLLAKARRIASVVNWNLHTRAGIQPYQHYFWAGKEKVFFFRSGAKIARLLCSHDLITGKETQYRKVSKMWSDDGWFKQDIEISPDGQWVLWDGDYREKDYSYHGDYVARLDGSQKLHLAYKHRREVSWSWLPDSNLLETTGRYDDQTEVYTRLKMAKRSVSHPRVTQVLSRKQTEFYSSLDGSSEMQSLPGDRVILATDKSINSVEAYYDLKEMAVTAEPSLLHHWKITLPTPAYLTISPDGRHLAWFHSTPTTTKNIIEVSLYISRIDGSQKEEIGHIKILSFDKNYIPDEYPRLLKWLPNSKRVSFLYHDTLYTAPR